MQKLGYSKFLKKFQGICSNPIPYGIVWFRLIVKHD